MQKEGISQVLKNLRISKKITKTDAAKIAGVSINSYSSWEDGCTPKVNVAIKLADYYDVSLDYLYCRDMETKSGSPEMTADEARVLKVYRTLDGVGQHELLKTAMDLMLANSTAEENMHLGSLRVKPRDGMSAKEQVKIYRQTGDTSVFRKEK